MRDLGVLPLGGRAEGRGRLLTPRGRHVAEDQLGKGKGADAIALLSKL